MRITKCMLVALVCALSPFTQIAGAEPVSSFRGAVTRAVLSSPRVNASWFNFEASREAEQVVRGRYYPSVDLIAEIGREKRETPAFEIGHYTRDAARVSVTQMLFDGFQTREEVAQLNFEKLALYYQLQRDSQEAALEGAQAYLDMVKYQELVRLAEQNYVVHRQVHDRIAERAMGGVARGVDLEQAAGRVALSETNLLTEMTNLYDVQTRFQRVVGELPAEDLALPEVATTLMLPDSRRDALNLAYGQSPVINAAIENLRSTQSALNSTNGPMMPRFDLRARYQVEHDTDGFEGRYEEEAIELIMTYNLYRGGTDSARKRQFNNLYYFAVEERKQACLNVRQSVLIAYNDVRSLEEQLIYLDQTMMSQDKTRRAYRDQFNLGDRTLLDLLDSQNEYFDAQRAFFNAKSDLLTAQARTLSNMGLLLTAMDVDGLNAEKIEELDLNLERPYEDENTMALCPPETSEPRSVDKEALFASLMAGNYRNSDRGDDYDYDSGYGAATVTPVAVGAAAASRYREVGENQVALELNVLFNVNSSYIANSYDDEVYNAAAFLHDHPEVKAIVEGHTSSTGTPEYNQWLSERRARRVREMLIEEHNIDPGQITAVGFGQTNPVASNDTDEGREMNRRIDLVLDGN
jgi:outer membrane protein, adhesin transport system